jgi:DNA-binding MarR family transcriptional regulator
VPDEDEHGRSPYFYRSDPTDPGLTAGTLILMRVVRWLDSTEQQAWRTLIEVHSRLVAQLDAELQEAHGISLPDYEVLVHLSEAPEGALRMAELAAHLMLSPSGLTRRLDGLVRDGLVERRACPSDRRGSFAVLTEKGRAVLEEAAPTHVEGVRRYVIDPLSRDELMAFAGALCHIGQGLPDRRSLATESS